MDIPARLQAVVEVLGGILVCRNCEGSQKDGGSKLSATPSKTRMIRPSFQRSKGAPDRCAPCNYQIPDRITGGAAAWSPGCRFRPEPPGFGFAASTLRACGGVSVVPEMWSNGTVYDLGKLCLRTE
jgi:hypothetical protein